MMLVLLGTNTSVISCPSTPLIGVESGRTTSCRVLYFFQIAFNQLSKWMNKKSIYRTFSAHTKQAHNCATHLISAKKITKRKDDNHILSVSRQTASRYGKAASSSYSRFPLRLLASTISWRSLLWTSWWVDKRWSIRASALEVVSIAANVKVLLSIRALLRYDMKFDTYLIWPSSSSFDILSSSDALILAFTIQLLSEHSQRKQANTHSRCS